MRARGKIFEQRAKALLQRAGLTFVAENVTYPCGELDLVMRHGSTIVFIEVRHRGKRAVVSALESISPRKIAKWQRAAERYLLSFNLSLDTADCRFDVVAFDGDEPVWIENFLGS